MLAAWATEPPGGSKAGTAAGAEPRSRDESASESKIRRVSGRVGAMKPDIIWFLLDGVRPDRLASCGGKVPHRTFLDQVLESATLFTNSITAGPYTLLAVNALFTGLYGTTNGVNGAYKTTTDDLDPDAISVTDILKRHGYTTMCYSGSPFEPMEPIHSFDIYRLQPRLDDGVIREYQAAPKPRFLCLSFQSVHDLCCNEPEKMIPENYDRAVCNLSREFEHFYRRLVDPEDMVMVYSDHGMRLREEIDPDWDWNTQPETEPTTGVYLSEDTIRTFTALIHPNLFPPRRFSQVVRSIDMAPTLLEALGLPPLGAQGESLWPFLRETNGDGQEFPERVAYCETGGRWFSPWRPNIRGVRTNRWKFTRHDVLGEALFDLASDPREQENLFGRGLFQEVRLRAELDAQIRQIERPARSIYEESGVDHRSYVRSRPPAAAVPEFAQVMNAYEGICNALAEESVAGVGDHASAVVRLAQREMQKAGSEAEQAAFRVLHGIAQQFDEVADLATARKIFGELSKLFILFIGERPLFMDSVAAYQCRDAPGYNKWVQKRNDDRMMNPYLGRDSNATIREIGFAA
jgi:hypothetical protein